VYSGVHLIGFNKDVRARAGIEIGDEVIVELERYDEPREVDAPSELEQALAASSKARAAYERLSYTHRREYAEWIAGAKRQETRERRAARALGMLEAGERHP
jgi:uncharacterized protein YdeI (YjbR/CyaY-like superfamily)